jgi:hypothetical protein
MVRFTGYCFSLLNGVQKYKITGSNIRSNTASYAAMQIACLERVMTKTGPGIFQKIIFLPEFHCLS